MQLIVNLEKKHFYILSSLFVLVFSAFLVKGLAGDGLPWHPLQGVSTNSTGLVSVDADGDGIIDTSEGLNPPGDIYLNNHKIRDVASPNAGDLDSTVATKGYVLAQAGGSPSSWTCQTVSTGYVNSHSGSVTCPAGFKVITGGCYLQNNDLLLGSYPTGAGWACVEDSSGPIGINNILAYCCQ